jgi:hypothetical protein
MQDLTNYSRHLPLFLLLLCSSCVLQPPVPQKSQLEIRQMQTREYQRPQGGAKQVMKAVINVLQDEGYIIKNADKELGFITATKETDIQNQWEAFFSQLANSENPRFSKNSIVECSVNISDYGSDTRVRAIFQLKVQDNLGGIVSVSQIDDPFFYQQFFSKVDKGIFIDKQKL